MFEQSKTLRALDHAAIGTGVKEKCQMEISNTFTTLESLDETLDIIRENINTSANENLRYHRLKFNKPGFDDEYSKLIGQRKQSKLQ
jgi:hypothetical protein